jgi:hypothetical protein
MERRNKENRTNLFSSCTIRCYLSRHYLPKPRSLVYSFKGHWNLVLLIPSKGLTRKGLGYSSQSTRKINLDILLLVHLSSLSYKGNKGSRNILLKVNTIRNNFEASVGYHLRIQHNIFCHKLSKK